jgi:hypothetical protein
MGKGGAGSRALIAAPSGSGSPTIAFGVGRGRIELDPHLREGNVTAWFADLSAATRRFDDPSFESARPSWTSPREAEAIPAYAIGTGPWRPRTPQARALQKALLPSWPPAHERDSAHARSTRDGAAHRELRRV